MDTIERLLNQEVTQEPKVVTFMVIFFQRLHRCIPKTMAV